MVENNPEVVRLPYKNTYVDGEIIEAGKHLPKQERVNGRFAFLFQEVSDSLLTVFTFFYKSLTPNGKEKTWGLWPSSLLFSIGKKFKDYDQSVISQLTIRGIDLNSDCIEILLDLDLNKYPGMDENFLTSKILPAINETSMAMAVDVSKTLFTFCSFLSCKNISTLDHDPPAKLNKKRAKKGKCPIFTYKTLVIKPTSKAQKDQEAQGLWENRIHLCRGHFKEYTPERPLFGKLTGRYWWQPSVRGRNREGIVMKDYKIEHEKKKAPGAN
jgi:hypothetical protein